MLPLLLLTGVLVLAPAKPYSRLDEPLTINFLQSTSDSAEKALDTLGLDAVKLPDAFKGAPPEFLFSGGPKPLFRLYILGGAEITPKEQEWGGLPKLSSPQNILPFYPDIAKGGTFILTWKTATPLVIQALPKPVPQGYLEHANPNERDAMLKSFSDKTPIIYHVVPLQYALINTDAGDIKATFFYADAPHTVDNFIALATQKFYDGGVFHRIIKDFMIQGGDSATGPDAGTGGPGYQINAEFSAKSHVRGTLSMARAGYSVDSAGSQFFIMHGDKPFLDSHYSAFGKVIDGLPIVDKIAQTPVSDDNGTVTGPKPKILSIKILPATPDLYGLPK